MHFLSARRACLTIVGFGAAASLVACGSSGSSPSGGNTVASSGRHSGQNASSDASTAPSDADFPTSQDAFTQKAQAALSRLTSEHLVIAEKVGSTTERGVGDLTVENSRYKDARLTLTLPGYGTIRLLTVDGTQYVSLPASRRDSGKPWQRVSSASSDPVIKSLARTSSSTQALTGPAAVQHFLSAATSFRYTGNGTLPDGTPVGEYALRVDLSAVPGLSATQRQALATAKITSVPVTFGMDSDGNIREQSITIDAGSMSSTATARTSRLNQPVRITAPPASQIGPG